MGHKATRDDFHPNFFTGIAHRGLHDETRTENGLRAFAHAMEEGFPFELDVHLTADGKLAVCHDSDLKRTTGKSGIIEALTSAEIQENYRLLDGEKVPLLTDVLDLCQEQDTIVCELKPYGKNWKPLAKEALREVSGIKDKKSLTFISFDPRALWHLGRHCGFQRGLLLSSTRKDIMLFRNCFEYLDIDMLLIDDPRMVAYRKKGGILNVWTIRNAAEFKAMKAKADTVTFDGLPLETLMGLCH